MTCGNLATDDDSGDKYDARFENNSSSVMIVAVL